MTNLPRSTLWGKCVERKSRDNSKLGAISQQSVLLTAQSSQTREMEFTCDNCMETYDDNVRPRSLNCGHSFCTTCLNNSITDNTLLCYTCKESYPATSAEDFPINYSMEALILKVRKARLGASPSQQSGNGTQPSQSESMNSKLQIFYNENKAGLRNLLQQNKDKMAQLHQYEDFLIERKTTHEDLFYKIHELEKQNEDMVTHIDTEHKKLREIMKEGENLRNVSTSNMASLGTSTTAKSMVTASDRFNACYASLGEWNENCQKSLPDVRAITDSEKLVRDTTAALRMVNIEEEEAATETLDLSNSSLPVMDKLNRIRGKDTLRVTSLRSMTNSVRNLVEEGHLRAVQEHEGRLRSAEVTLKDNHIYLHYLQDGDQPVHAHTIQQRDLIGALKSDSVIAFLDLAWDGACRGRVHIQLTPDTPFAQHFRILCTGDHGPSYAKSKLLKVLDKGDAKYERMLGGDYEHNDGSGGASLIKGLNMMEDVYTRLWNEGKVYANSNQTDGPLSAQFVIGTGTGHGHLLRGIFGQVQDGLDVVKAAVKLDDVQGVTIFDCGVMLPF